MPTHGLLPYHSCLVGYHLTPRIHYDFYDSATSPARFLVVYLQTFMLTVFRNFSVWKHNSARHKALIIHRKTAQVPQVSETHNEEIRHGNVLRTAEHPKHDVPQVPSHGALDEGGPERRRRVILL